MAFGVKTMPSSCERFWNVALEVVMTEQGNGTLAEDWEMENLDVDEMVSYICENIDSDGGGINLARERGYYQNLRVV